MLLSTLQQSRYVCLPLAVRPRLFALSPGASEHRAAFRGCRHRDLGSRLLALGGTVLDGEPLQRRHRAGVRLHLRGERNRRLGRRALTQSVEEACAAALPVIPLAPCGACRLYDIGRHSADS
jgi:hypothetical protein